MSPSWQAELAASFNDPLELLTFLDLDPNRFPGLLGASREFPFRVTRAYADRIVKSNPDDPLLRQVLPRAEELAPQPGFAADPVGDMLSVTGPGILHKYLGRVLLITTGACAIHCRYCFRRSFPYDAYLLGRSREDEALGIIAADTSVREVILSGGDPLVLSDGRLARLIAAIGEIPHVRRLRIHTRLPIVLPSRITPDLVGVLADSRLRTAVVIHANHAAEFDASVHGAVDRLRSAGLVLLNQSVLLRGINDDPGTLADLSETLFENGVLPYYLHLLDRAQGTAHFDVPAEHGRHLIEAMRKLLPGYLVPRLVREDAGGAFKTPLG